MLAAASVENSSRACLPSCENVSSYASSQGGEVRAGLPHNVPLHVTVLVP